MYCQRDRSPDIFDSIKELENSIQVFSNVKDFISVRKQNIANLLNQFKSFNQSPAIELKNIDFILRKEGDLSSITTKSRPKRHSKGERNAQNKTTAFSSFS